MGQVTEVFLPVDRATDKPRGFAFVEFGDAASVSQAIEKMDGTELNGRNLRVSEARDRAPRPPMGGPPSFMDDGPPSMDFGRRPAKPKGSRRGLRGRQARVLADQPGVATRGSDAARPASRSPRRATAQTPSKQSQRSVAAPARAQGRAYASVSPGVSTSPVATSRYCFPSAR